MDERLAAIRDVRGQRRFYPPGSHPAVAQLKDALRKAKQFRDLVPDDPNVRALIESMEADIVRFEQPESEAKMRAYERLNAR